MNQLFPRPIPKILEEFSKKKGIIIRVSVICIKKKKVYFLKSIVNNQEAWFLPGGTVEKNERLKNTLKREIKEELGVRIKIKRIIGLIDIVIPDKFRSIEIIFFGYLKDQPKFIKEKLLPNDDQRNHYSVEGKWLNLSQISKKPVYPKKTIKKLLLYYTRHSRLPNLIYFNSEK